MGIFIPLYRPNSDAQKKKYTFIYSDIYIAGYVSSF